ncbi:GNAT family N-acetyltransferase [Kytococcus sedentarius]|uniref:GNAT family N-acetyltransferase n=1 Tax=Kytococcus sedentarius TaxID=1276 RepID=UPI0035BC0D32
MRGELRRDAAGIPWVLAATEPDLLHAQGWVTARDRTWQLVSDRWRAHGVWADAVRGLRVAGTEVADAVHDTAAEWDRFAGRIGIRATAERSLAALSDPTRAWVEAYAAGVREGLERVDAAAVPELAALAERGAGAAGAGVDLTGPPAVPDWRAWDAADCLAVFWVQQVLFGDWPHQLWRQHVTEQLGAEWVERLAADPSAQASGSNAIGVAGARAAGGAPLLASDPHRLLEAPNVYQQVRLTLAPGAEGSGGTGYDVAGLAFPGVPGVQHLGHTGEAAWVITNAMARTQDLLPLPASGPDADATALWGRPGEPGARQVRQAADLVPGLGFEALPLLLRARTAADATRAWDHWVEPANCVVVADRQTVLEGVAGRPLDVVDAGEGPWSAHEPWREVTGTAVHANHRRDQTRRWGRAFAPPHRAHRIEELLRAGSGPDCRITAVDLARVQLDTRSGGLVALLEATGVRAVDHPVARVLAGFDGHMDPGSATALLAWRWRTALARRVADLPELAALHRDSQVTQAARAEFPTLFEPWLDVVARVGLGLESLAAALPDRVAACAREALDDVMTAGAVPGVTAAGDMSPDHVWGAEHHAGALHALGWPVPLGPVGGDVDCVAATSSIPGRTAASVRGPVSRAVLDLADPAASRWAVPLGASGDLGATSGRNQTEAWRTGALLPVFEAHERPAGAEVTAPQLTFTPVDPAVDGPVIHAWATQNRGRFWGMADHTVQEVVEIYAWLDASPHHHAWMVTHAGQSVALWQTYDPAHDPVGEAYPVRRGDLGMHLMIGPCRHGIADLPALVGVQGAQRAFADPSVRRLVAEPDVRNRPAIARLLEAGFSLGEVTDLGHKTAQFAFLERSAFTARSTRSAR